jgi:small subunit ribosomal protein S4e
MGPKKVPYLITHDARTIRYPDPHIKSNDTVRVDIESGKIQLDHRSHESLF